MALLIIIIIFFAICPDHCSFHFVVLGVEYAESQNTKTKTLIVDLHATARYPVLPRCQLKAARATPNPDPNRNVQVLSTKIASFF